MGAFNGSGTFVRTYNWTTDDGNGINIEFSRMDTEDDGFATGLSTCITKDGQTTITANIPFNSKKITGLANGSARTDSIALGQVQDNTYEYLGENGGAADAYTWTPSPAITAYTAGQKWLVKIGSGDGNTGASTADISGLGTRTIDKSDGAGSTTALVSGDMVAGGFYELYDNGSTLTLQNPEIDALFKCDAIATSTGIKDEDDMSSDSATALATQQSIKAYADNIPMFRAYMNSAQTIANTTITKLQFDTESFDTNSWYDNSTNYRYTPLKAGKYLVVVRLRYNSSANSDRDVFIYKNGSNVAQNRTGNPAGATNTSEVMSLIDMNGSTDYLEAFSQQSSGSNMDTYTGVSLTEFSAIYIGV